MTLRHPSSEKQASRDGNLNQTCHSISQLLVFNTTVCDIRTSTVSYYYIERECPLPIYVWLKIHGLKRGCNLIDELFSSGLDVSIN